MSVYQKISNIGSKVIGKHKLFKWGFNLVPMYRMTTARIDHVSKDLMSISIKLPINYKNKNYVGSIFGGSLFSSVDPIPMVQLMNILDDNYVVWDKSAQITFKSPAKENLCADFIYTQEEIRDIERKVKANGEYEIVKSIKLTNLSKDKIYCEVDKTIYIASKEHYRLKSEARKRCYK